MTKKFIFIVGVHTGVGKTYVSTQLLQSAYKTQAHWLGLKPLISGWDPLQEAASDTGLILAAQGMPLSIDNIEKISPWRYHAPLGVAQAAQKEGKSVIFDDLVEFCIENSSKSDIVLIETAGGLMSPITETKTNLDWVAAIGGEVLLVTGNYLGAINHTLMALQILKSIGIIPQVVLSESSSELPLELAREGLMPFLEMPPLIVPKGSTLSHNIKDIHV
jgi:dethiobiotin synthetase